MKQIIKNQKGIGVIIAVFAVAIIIITILSTVYIYIAKIAKHQALIKEAYQGTQVMEEFAKLIRDSYDRYVSNSFDCPSGFGAVPLGNLTLCRPTGEANLKVEHLNKTYYIPLTDLEVSMHEEEGDQKFVRLRIYLENSEKARLFVKWHRKLDRFFNEEVYQNISYLSKYLNTEQRMPKLSKGWVDFARAQTTSTTTVSTTSTTLGSTTTTLHSLQITDLSNDANLSIACRGNFYRNECVNYCQRPDASCNYCSFNNNHPDCLHLALTECGNPAISSLSACTTLESTCKDSVGVVLDSCTPILEEDPSLTPAELEEERKKICSYSTDLGNCQSAISDPEQFAAQTSKILGNCLASSVYPENHCLYYCTISSIMPKPEGCKEVVKRMVDSTPPSCPLPSDPDYATRDPLCVDCDQAGCLSLEYCLYGYDGSALPISPCDSSTGEGYVKQYIKVICHSGDTACIP